MQRLGDGPLAAGHPRRCGRSPTSPLTTNSVQLGCAGRDGRRPRRRRHQRPLRLRRPGPVLAALHVHDRPRRSASPCGRSASTLCGASTSSCTSRVRPPGAPRVTPRSRSCGGPSTSTSARSPGATTTTRPPAARRPAPARPRRAAPQPRRLAGAGPARRRPRRTARARAAERDRGRPSTRWACSTSASTPCRSRPSITRVGREPRARGSAARPPRRAARQRHPGRRASARSPICSRPATSSTSPTTRSCPARASSRCRPGARIRPPGEDAPYDAVARGRAALRDVRLRRRPLIGVKVAARRRHLVPFASAAACAGRGRRRPQRRCAPAAATHDPDPIVLADPGEVVARLQGHRSAAAGRGAGARPTRTPRSSRPRCRRRSSPGWEWR